MDGRLTFASMSRHMTAVSIDMIDMIRFMTGHLYHSYKDNNYR
jgi:hypothetical protein